MKQRLAQGGLALLMTGVSLVLGLYFLSPDAGRALRDYQSVSFSDLGFPFKKRAHQLIPPEVMGLNDQRVRIDGFMVPVDFQGRQVRSFVLVKTQNEHFVSPSGQFLADIEEVLGTGHVRVMGKPQR